MEKIIPFKKTDYTFDGIHIRSGKFIMDQQSEWEAAFHDQFNPYYANSPKDRGMQLQTRGSARLVQKCPDDFARIGSCGL